VSLPSKTPGPLPAEALGHSLDRILAHPLSALRASIESLVAALDREAPGGKRLDGALEEVTRLARDVETLVELAAPRPLAPARCSIDEVALGALRGLPPRVREHVRYARTGQDTSLQADAPLLSRCLTYLLQAACPSASGGPLLRGHHEGARTIFSIVSADGRLDLLPDCIDPSQGREEVARAIRVVAAERDLVRMGARLSVHPTDRGLACITVELSGEASTPDPQEEGA